MLARVARPYRHIVTPFNYFRSISRQSIIHMKTWSVPQFDAKPREHAQDFALLCSALLIAMRTHWAHINNIIIFFAHHLQLKMTERERATFRKAPSECILNWN